MPVKITHKITYVGDIQAQTRALTKTVKKAFTKAGNEILGKYIPARFTVAGGDALGYQRRDDRYTARKFRQKGHRRPFMFSGAMRREALATRRRTATSKKINVNFNIDANKLRFLRKRGYDPIAAMSGLTKKEMDRLLQIIDKEIQAGINNNREKRTVRL